MKHLYLIDGSGYIFRAYFAIPPRSTKAGVPTNAIFGFTNMLIKLLRDSQADGLAVIFDASGTSFRNDIYDAYKANRDEPPEDLIPQFAGIREATLAFNLPCLELQGYEADDLIATYAKLAQEKGIEVTIVSSDKDLMQLVRDGVGMLDPMKDKSIGRAEVIEKFGVPPEKVIDVQALAGDSVDNVPGVPGIGVKTAAQLIEEYGSLEELLQRAGEIKQPKRRERLTENAEMARLSKQLVTLDEDAPVAEIGGRASLDEFGLLEPEPQSLRAFLEKYEFRSVLTRLADKLGEGDLVPDHREAGKEGAAAAEPADAAAQYSLVQDAEALKAWVEKAREAGAFAVDTETTSLDAQRAELVGVSMSVTPKEACYIPLGHKAQESGDELELSGGEVPKQIPMEEALALLKPLLADPSVLKIGQNLKYDICVLARYGVDVAPLDDTMLLSYVLEAGLHGHGMDELAELHLGHKTISYSEVAGKGKSQVTFDRVPLDKALDYAAEDADVTLQLHQALKRQLVPAGLVTVYETMERPLVPVLAEMERTGIKVDRAILRRLSNELAQQAAELEEEIYKLAGRPFTIGSPKQLGEILFDEMGLEGGKKTKTGAHATGADVLETLAAQGHELPAKVLDWRQITKLKSTYTDALQDQINPDTGRVHTSYSQAVASTGRLSSTDPNLQNIPVRTEEGRKIRTAFVAEEGMKLVSIDYSQIELRLTAHIAEVDALKQAFADGEDIHAVTASQVFGVPLAEMDPMTRRKAKAINFGIIYGISAFGLANNLRIPQSEAKAFIEAYFARYPGIKDYMNETKALAREHGYVETLFGRRIHIPAIKEKNPSRRAFGDRAAINAPIQGTAADIIKRAMIRIPPSLEGAKLSARMLLQVHDELLFEVPDAEVEKTVAVVREVMENANRPAVQLSVPLVADAGVGDNWDEAH